MEIIIDNKGFSKVELIAATNLKSIFEAYFISNPCEGEIYLCNYQLPANFDERDIDILALLRINEGSKIKVEINGSIVNIIGGFIFNIETKAHSQFSFENNNNIVVKYPDGSKKDATRQAWTMKNNLMKFLNMYIENTLPRIHDYVYLPNCDQTTTLAIINESEKIPSNFLDGSLTAEQIFSTLVRKDWTKRSFGFIENAETIIEIKDFLTSVKSLPKFYSNRLDLLAMNSFDSEKNDLFSDSNNFYTIEGSPGAGKTILMLSKCFELLKQNKICLYLTFNKQLVYDLKRLQENLKILSPKNLLLNLKIETWDSYLTKLYSFNNYYIPLGSPSPTPKEKLVSLISRYAKNPKELLLNDELKNSNNIYKYGKVEYVFIDEAQDLPAEVFQLLKLFYNNNICLAIGKQQEFIENNLPENGNKIILNKIYRQKEKPSDIVKKYLEHTKLEHSYHTQIPIPLELVGGNAIVYTGKINEDFYDSILNYLNDSGFSNIDFLHLHNFEGESMADTKLPHYSGGDKEQVSNLNLNNFRYYHYNSCRGLEGTIILYQNIDLYYEWCKEKFGEDQALKRVFVALTRVKDFPIFTFFDLNHWLYTNVIANHTQIKSNIIFK